MRRWEMGSLLRNSVDGNRVGAEFDGEFTGFHLGGGGFGRDKSWVVEAVFGVEVGVA